MAAMDYVRLTEYAKAFTGLTADKEELLRQAADKIKPGLPEVTERFYRVLQRIDSTAPFVEDRLDQLKSTHLSWLEGLFSGPFDAQYTETMYRVGQVHAKVHLPVEFMSGGTSLIAEELMDLIGEAYGDDPRQCLDLLKAVNAIMGFSLLIMQQSFQNSSLTAELDRFLAITGMSRTLFENLAGAYKN